MELNESGMNLRPRGVQYFPGGAGKRPGNRCVQSTGMAVAVVARKAMKVVVMVLRNFILFESPFLEGRKW